MAQEEGQSEAEKLLRDYQTVQEQLRGTALQLDQLQAQKTELERADEEIKNSTGKVYIAVGSVIVETTKDKAASDIKEKKELTEVRITSTTKQYNDLKAKEKQLSSRLTQIYKQGQGAS